MLPSIIKGSEQCQFTYISIFWYVYLQYYYFLRKQNK